MDFSDIDVCQNEIESMKGILQYMQKREASMSVVYDTLAQTMQKSQDTCKVLKDVKQLLDRTRSVFFFLENREVVSTTKETRPCEEQSKVLIQDVSKPRTVPHPTKESVSTLKREGDPRERRVQATRPPRRASMAPRPAVPRHPRPSIVNKEPQIGARTRIRHNSDYPKPWLDRPKPSDQQNARRQSIQRRQSMAQGPSRPGPSRPTGNIIKRRLSSAQASHQPQRPQRQWQPPTEQPQAFPTEPLRSTRQTTLLQQPRRASFAPAAQSTRVYRTRGRTYGVNKLAKINEM